MMSAYDAYSFPTPYRSTANGREEKILVRIISPIGEEFHYRLAPSCTIYELKRQFQAYKPQLKADKLFFFHELKNIENDTRIEELDFEFIPQLDSSGQLTTSYKMKAPSSIALLYGFDYLGRWSNKSARQREFYDEIMATHLLRFDAKGFEANQILDKLYLGNINAAFNLTELRAMGITHIVTAHNSLKPLYPKYFSYLTVEAEDLYYVNLIDHFESVIKFIDEGRRQGGVLIHCAAGISRSSTLTIAYLMQTMGFSLSEAYKYVRERRPIISPNDGFTRQLQVYQELECNLMNASDEQREFLNGYKKTTVEYQFCFTSPQKDKDK
eukprot:TRINITY_DN2252_c0_g1_i1.p1 TRINITY_DN2252_c0_g1~~TRINITY_DN2252_c0_g1_i1.p1  ORF type:complete len:326 (-),score=61.22 TRINITY_DN2252_c0_g1_i1:36-1013(-)